MCEYGVAYWYGGGGEGPGGGACPYGGGVGFGGRDVEPVTGPASADTPPAVPR